MNASDTPTTSLWRHPEFLKFWAGQSVSVFGSAITQLALPLTAVNLLNATPAEMGLLNAAQMLPFAPQDGQQAATDSAGDADNAEARDAAYGRGKRAFDRGMTLDACPPDLKKDEAMSEAWAQGWKDARDEKEAAQ